MSTYSTAAINAGLNAIGGLAGYVAAFTDTNEASAGAEVAGAPYARKPVTWAAAANKVKSLAAPVELNIPAGTTVRRLGLFTAASGGTLVNSQTLPAPETFGADGVMTVNVYDLPGGDL